MWDGEPLVEHLTEEISVFGLWIELPDDERVATWLATTAETIAAAIDLIRDAAAVSLVWDHDHLAAEAHLATAVHATTHAAGLYDLRRGHP